MRIIKSLAFLAFLLTALSAAGAAQNTAERLEPGREAQPIKKEGPRLKEKLFEPVTVDLIQAATYPLTVLSAVALDDMSTGTTQLVGPSLDDTASAVTNIGFEFWYDGVRFTQFSVNANGLARLGSTVVGTTFSNLLASTTNAPKIAPYFEDLCTGTNGNVRFKVTGSSPNRKLVVEWNNMQVTRGAGCAGVGGGTFQMWLFESAAAANPGVIQFVYGNGIVASQVADAGASIGLQSGAATNFASVTASTDTVSYAAANDINAAGIAAGKSYVFTPNVPAAPTGLSFTAVNAVGMTLNWTDNAANELGYAIYRSTDGINFTFLNSIAAGSTSFADSGLTPSTNYTYRVFAFTEGALSPALSGSQATSAPGNVTSTTSGVWSNPATWVGGVVPTSGDNVTIQNVHIVTIDTASNALNVTVQNGGFLEFEATTARTLTVGQAVTIDSGGQFRSNPTGTQTGHVLSVGGNLTNNGFLDFSTNGDTAGAVITFGAGASNVTFGGSGPTTDVRSITVAKGAQATIVELNPTNFTVQGVNTDLAGFLTVTSGTFKISGTFTMTNRTFPGPTYSIPLAGGLWMNNPNYIVAATAAGTTTNNNGLFRMTSGTYNIGLTGADGMGGSTGATFIIEGGTINATRIDPQSAVTWTQTAGTINAGTVANTRSNFGTFELFSSASAFTMSGGTFNLIQAAVAATPVDFRVLSASLNITGGVVNVGTSATATNFNFRLAGNTPNIVIDNTTNNKTATFSAQTLIFGRLTVNPGTTANLNGFLVAIIGPTLTNNGTLTGTTAGSRLYFLGSGVPQTYTGAGTVTAPLASFDVDNILGVTIDPGASQIVTARMILFTGNLTNTSKLTLGNGGTTTGTVQIGNTTTPTAAGSYDTAPVFNLGTGGQIATYLRTTIGRTTGIEINPTRTLTNLTYDDNNGLHQLSVAGGDLTVTGTLTLTNGVINTGSNTLTHNGTTVTRTNGYVNGRLNRSYTATGAYTYHVGQNGYSPVAGSVTAGTFPSSLSFSSSDSTLPGFDPAKSTSRNWNSIESGDLTATLSFTYPAGDVNGIETDYRVFGQTTNLCPAAPCVVTATHIAGPVLGVTAFARFTAGEAQTPVAATIGSITGRTTTSFGSGIRNILVTISGGDLAQPRTTYTSTFGYYQFGGLTIGQTYTLTITPKRFVFPTTSRLVTVGDNAVFVDFISNP